MRRKRILMLIGSVCLALMLALPLVASCGPATPEEAAEEIAALESKLAAEKSKVSSLQGDVSDLEAEIAKLKKPAEVIKILFQNCEAIGSRDNVVFGAHIEEALEELSDGRMQVSRVCGEAMVPSGEQLEATRDGIFQLFLSFPVYYYEKIPALKALCIMSFVLPSDEDVWNLYHYLGVGDIMAEAYAKWNIHHIQASAEAGSSGLVSTVPVPDFAALSGLKIRSFGSLQAQLEAAGAATVWLPGEEIYTALATGLVDAATWGGPTSMIDMGLHEVTEYWVWPLMEGNCMYDFLANMDFWNALSEPDRSLIEEVIQSATREVFNRRFYEESTSIARLAELGVTVNYWDTNSIKQWKTVGFSVLEEEKPTDPAALEAYNIAIDYMRARGYID